MKRPRDMAVIWGALLVGMLSGAVSCTRSLDMSGERLGQPGTEWGLVIGSVLVQPQTSDARGPGRAASEETYEFDIVQIQPGDPDGENPYAERYRLTAQAGTERLFVSRLRSGQYLIRNFHKTGVMGIGGDLNLTFSSMAEEVRYVGRLHVTIPQRPSRGKGYHFTVENTRDADLAGVAKTHPNLTNAVVNVPLQARPDAVP